jgi:hypothetical protein
MRPRLAVPTGGWAKSRLTKPHFIRPRQAPGRALSGRDDFLATHERARLMMIDPSTPEYKALHVSGARRSTAQKVRLQSQLCRKPAVRAELLNLTRLFTTRLRFQTRDQLGEARLARADVTRAFPHESCITHWSDGVCLPRLPSDCRVVLE